MGRFKRTEEKQMQFIPVSFAEQVLPGTLEHAICEIIDHHVDLSHITDRYKNGSLGAPAFPPAMMLKLILIAYSKGILSSRKIEVASRENVLFMAICGNLRPDHSTIASFLSSLTEEVKGIFADVLFLAAQLDLIGGEVFALDGCKLSSNAAKEWSGTHAELEKKKRKLSRVLGSLIEEHGRADAAGDTERVAQTARSVESYAKKIARVKAFLAKAEPRSGARGREVKSNITDNESAKIPGPHGVVQGYNGIAMVDAKHQIVLAAEAFGSGQEHDCLSPLLDQAEEALRKIGVNEEGLAEKKLLADSNYSSEENLKILEERKIDGCIPDHQFRRRDPRFPERNTRRTRTGLFDHGSFTYESEADRFRCPAGALLSLEARKTVKGYRGRQYGAAQSDCAACPLRGKCLRARSKRRTLFIVEQAPPRSASEAMREKIDRPEYRRLYARRMGIVEPVFANVTVAKGMREFTVRGKRKVNCQWLLYLLVHNIEKIRRFGRRTTPVPV